MPLTASEWVRSGNELLLPTGMCEYFMTHTSVSPARIGQYTGVLQGAHASDTSWPNNAGQLVTV